MNALLVAMLCGLFRLSLGLFPRDFRAAHSREMVTHFEDVLRERSQAAGWWGGLRFSLRASLDVVRQALRERGRTGPPPGHGQRPNNEPGKTKMTMGTLTDVRIAVRTLAKNPGFALAAIIVLALGIGANVTVFSALKVAILDPAPYRDVEALAFADLTLAEEGRPDVETMVWSYPKYRVLKASLDRPFSELSGFAIRSATLTEAGSPARLSLELVDPDYFGMLGMDPPLGRGFGADEADPAEPPLVAVLSDGLWRERFGADPSIVGTDVVMNGQRLAVVGVAPVGFRGLSGSAQAWIPLAASGAVIHPFMVRGSQAHWMTVVGRLAPDVSFDEARARMASVGNAVAEQYPSSESGVVYSGSARPFEDVRVNEAARQAVVLLSSAAALVLLVACANLSGLLLTRVKRRMRDGAVRLAVGASRFHLIRASLIEAGVLAAAGGALGLVLALWGTRAMAAAWPSQFLRSADGAMSVMSTESFGLDGGVLAFAVAATVATVVLFGLLPAVRASGSDVAAHLKAGTSAGRRGRRLLGLDGRAWLVGAQVGLALVLLIGAGLVGGSMTRLLSVDLGFESDGLLIFRYEVPRESAWQDDIMGFNDTFLERVEALPGVRAAAVGTPPLGGHWSITLVREIEGRPRFEQGEGPAIGINIVTPNYFETLGIPLERGRAFDATDGEDAFPTMVINRTAAEELFPGEDPIGKRIEVAIGLEDKERFAEIVGVVGDVHYGGLDGEVMAEAHFALREFGLPGGAVTVRADGEPLDVVGPIRGVLEAMEPSMPVFSVQTMDASIARSTGDRRVVLGLLGLFALVTVLLAATGTWGIVGNTVADRRRELGLRMALGADGADVLGSVLRRSMVAGALGLVGGLLAAWAGSRLLEAFLFQTSTRDPMAYSLAALLLLTVVGVASYLPARRATRVDPVEALRAE